MVEEYEEIADSQYQSERQELFDEDYGKQLCVCFFFFCRSDVSCAGLVAPRFLHLLNDLTAKFSLSLVDSISGLIQQSF